MVRSVGLMEISTKENLMLIIYKDMVDIHGLMVDNIKVFGRIIRCMVRVYLYGLMVVNIKDNI